MSRILKWSILGLLAYLIFLIAKLPASQLISRVELPNNISIHGVSGTIWQGDATSLVVNNIAIENVSWDLSFWRLLLLDAHLDLKAGNIRDSNEVSFQGPVSVSLINPTRLKADDLSVYLPANMILAQVRLPVAADATGRLKLVIRHLDYPGFCQSLEGQGQWLNAGLEGIVGLAQPLDLGNFDAKLSCIENDILIKIAEPNRFGLNADVRIPKDFKISLDARFRPDPDLPQQVLDAAKFFGRTDAQGYYQFRL